MGDLLFEIDFSNNSCFVWGQKWKVVCSTNEKSAVLFFRLEVKIQRWLFCCFCLLLFFLSENSWRLFFLVSIFHRTARSGTGSGILSIPWSPTGSGSGFPIPIFAVIPLFSRSGPKIKIKHILETRKMKFILWRIDNLSRFELGCAFTS